MYEVISECLAVVAVFGQGWCLQYFLGSFLEGRGRRKNGLAAALFYGVLRLAIRELLPFDYGDIRSVFLVALVLAAAALTALLFYRAMRRITAYLVVTFLAVNELAFFLAYLLMLAGNHLFDLWVWLLERGYLAAATTERLIEITVASLQFFFHAVYLALLYFVLGKIVRTFRDKAYPIQRTELHFLLVPGLVGLLICVLLRTITFTVEDGVPTLLYDRYPILGIVVFAILLLSLLSIFYGVKTFQDMIALNREKNSRLILEKQIGGLQEHMAELERIYSGIRSMKHDMKNTLAVIAGLSGEGEGELQTYLAELNQGFDRLEFQFRTGNTVVDTLLNMKYHEAVRSVPDIRFDAERLLFPEDLHIQGYDLGVVVGNALDNAIEACAKMKAKDAGYVFIRLSSFQRGRMFFLEVENSFDGRVVKRGQSEFPETDKADKKAHGIGLANIGRTAEKYHGAVDWSADNGIFTLSVMMREEGETEGTH